MYTYIQTNTINKTHKKMQSYEHHQHLTDMASKKRSSITCPECYQEGKVPRDAREFVCSTCTVATCVQCLQPAHHVVSCARHTDEQNLMLAVATQLVTCPKPGCDFKFAPEGTGKHIKCPDCKTRFCWAHGAVYTDPASHYCRTTLYPQSVTFNHDCALPGCDHLENKTSCLVNFGSVEEAQYFASRPHVRALAVYGMRLIFMEAAKRNDTFAAGPCIGIDDIWINILKFF